MYKVEVIGRVFSGVSYLVALHLKSLKKTLQKILGDKIRLKQQFLGTKLFRKGRKYKAHPWEIQAWSCMLHTLYLADIFRPNHGHLQCNNSEILGFNINIKINMLKFCLFVLIVLIFHSVEFSLVSVLQKTVYGL